MPKTKKKAPSKRKFFKTTITIEVVSEDEPVDNWNLGAILEGMDEGDLSGRWTGAHERLTGKEAAKMLRDQASDPQFFQLNDDGSDMEEA